MAQCYGRLAYEGISNNRCWYRDPAQWRACATTVVRVACVTVLVLLLWHTPATALSQRGRNIALGKKCDFGTPPDYPYCTDVERDPYKLTDGIYYGCRWTDKKGTVGWVTNRKRVFLIELDLGQNYPIEQIAFDTAAGKAEVSFPLGVLAFVSTDGQNYRFLGDVINEAPSQEKFINHRFVLGELKGWGRYICLAAVTSGFYLFSDEIEVIEGSHGEKEASYFADVDIPKTGLENFVIQMLDWLRQKNSSLSLLREAQLAVQDRAGLANDETTLRESLAKIDSSRRRVLSTKSVEPAEYFRGPPYRRFERPGFEAVGNMNSKVANGKPILIWPDPRRRLGLFDLPPFPQKDFAIRAEMMQNDIAQVSFVITSASSSPLTLSVEVEVFKGHTTILSTKIMQISQVEAVESFDNKYLEDAILPLDSGQRVSLPPGVTKRIWLSFETRGLNVPAGSYQSEIHVKLGDREIRTIPVMLTVHPLRLPDAMSLHSCNWAYFEEPPLHGLEQVAAKNLSDHYTDVLVANFRWLPFPGQVRKESDTRPLDFAKLEELINWNPGTRLWLIWPALELDLRSRFGATFGSSKWERSFSGWLIQIRDYLASRGIGTDRFAWYWVDEPASDRWEKIVLPASELSKRIDPNMLIWENPNLETLSKYKDQAIRLIDIICPSEPWRNARLLPLCGRMRFPSWSYTVISNKTQDPVSFYRLAAWRSWKHGLGGIGFWQYADKNSMSLSDHVNGVSFGVVYRIKDSLINSIRWEAWCQGITDYQYLTMLRAAVEGEKARKVSPTVLFKARQFLDWAPPRIASQDSLDKPVIDWHPDIYRHDILDLLNKLVGAPEARNGVR